MKSYLERWQPQLLLAPSLIACLLFFYGFMLWTGWISLTRSGMLPSSEFVGLLQYQRLFADERWLGALGNLARFATLFVIIPLVLGLLLAILLDQKLRAEGALRLVYLHPMALSLIVTGTVWRWLLDPELGLALGVRELGWTSFRFDWLGDEDLALYTLVIAAVWQISGFVMAVFLAGLRGVDEAIVQAARLDGAEGFTLYRRILLPTLGPSLFSALLVLLPAAIKSFDLVVALTDGGPGHASELPALYMFQMAFERSRLGLGAASAMVLLMMVLSVALPYVYARQRRLRSAG
ncbi:carbohydrate ABC transporter permease [Roseateles toxinivorans]|uniref:Carbohydrate ABC transporter membrane protein 1 (CUT1 family) n=1 Tax=Roseateles toxinivorans TaxID=270368 RepID=A0A4R6QSZ8_9BURK|nr:sugar ABC transporter permease [Roseateles toxinivorans]TDP73278.1 carbohydrate ABC transporter membrane protein 1 (CUT1 family) [Roseateles toxinivorans]